MSLDLSPTPLARSNHAAGKVYLALFEGAVLDTCSIFVNLHKMHVILKGKYSKGVNLQEAFISVDLLKCWFHLPKMSCFTTVVSPLSRQNMPMKARCRGGGVHLHSPP